MPTEAEYKYSVSARTPAQSSAPTITEIDEIKPVGSVSFTDEQNMDGEASLSVEPERVPLDIALRLKDLKQFPCELNVYRNDLLSWRGPLLSCQLQGPTLTLNARGLMYYLRYMTLEADLSFINQDQYIIGKGLVNAYQALDYGNYGIDTSAIGTSGITRTRRYFYKENHNVFDRLIELAEIDDGFDVWVDHDSRELMFDAERGNDLTMEVYADTSNIINPNIFWSVAADNLASNAIAVGTDPGGAQQSIAGTAEDTTVQQKWGRATVFVTAEDVTQQATINNWASRILATRNEQYFVPGPEVLTLEDVDPSTFGPGDVIQYSIKVGNLGLINVERRVSLRRVIVEADGNETMQIELI